MEFSRTFSRLRLPFLMGVVILLGAGCVQNPEPRSSPPPGGIYRSDDGGVTFIQKVSLEQDRADFSNRRALPHLARLSPREVIVSKGAPDTLVVVAAEGVFRTTTAGETWERLPVRAREVFSVSVHPGNPQILLAAGVSAFQGDRGKILKSLTGGRSWTDVFTAPTGAGETGTLVRRRQEVKTLVTVIAHAPTAPHMVLAGTNTGVLLSSTDGGVRWMTRKSFRQGITGLELSPHVPGRVLIRLADGQLVRSADSGVTTERVRVGRDSDNPFGFVEKPEVVHAVLFETPRADGTESILVGTEAGLYRSRDGGATWTMLPLPPTGTVNTPVTSLARGADGALWATSGFVLFLSTDEGATWRTSDTAIAQPLRFVITDPANPKRLYVFFAP